MRWNALVMNKSPDFMTGELFGAETEKQRADVTSKSNYSSLLTVL